VSSCSYIVTHGQGYSRFEHTAHGLSLELLQYVPPDDPIKISRLTIKNQSARPRRLSITTYVVSTEAVNMLLGRLGPGGLDWKVGRSFT
jgi:cellobiose phosphorylase